MNFTICKSLDDCTCENCINRTEFYVCRASPAPKVPGWMDYKYGEFPEEYK